MIDLYFKFADKPTAIKTLTELGFTHEDGFLSHEKAAVDQVGKIHKVTGTEEAPVIQELQGYHINIRTWDNALAELLGKRPEVITPNTPSRVWA